MRSRSPCEAGALLNPGEGMRGGMKMEALSEGVRREIAARLPEFLQRQRWFGGKARSVHLLEILDVIAIGAATLLVIGVKYAEGAEERYAVPVMRRNGDVVQDAMGDSDFLSMLLECVKRKETFRGERGSLRGCRTKVFDDLDDALVGEPRLIKGEQSNSSVTYGDRFILKFIRRMEDGENPDLEIGRFLSERTKYPHIAKVAGYLEYRSDEGGCVTQGILQEFVANDGDAWRHTQKVLSGAYGGSGEVLDVRLLGEMGLLGKRTAELHLALASERADVAFAPEEFTRESQRRLQKSFEALTWRTINLLHTRAGKTDARWREKCDEVESREAEILRRFQLLSEELIGGRRIRIHGDYHLGQVLYTGSDFVFIDFEGEPARSLAERRTKQSPLQDVAGMLRSFEYAAFAPLLMPANTGEVDASRSGELWRLAEEWSRAAGEQFLAEYFAACGDAECLPKSEEQRNALLKVYLLAKAVYELGYELNNRPSWVGLPVEGILRLLAA